MPSLFLTILIQWWLLLDLRVIKIMATTIHTPNRTPTLPTSQVSKILPAHLYHCAKLQGSDTFKLWKGDCWKSYLPNLFSKKKSQIAKLWFQAHEIVLDFLKIKIPSKSFNKVIISWLNLPILTKLGIFLQTYFVWLKN